VNFPKKKIKIKLKLKLKKLEFSDFFLGPIFFVGKNDKKKFGPKIKRLEKVRQRWEIPGR